MRHKLLKTANDLNKLILHSDEKVKAEFHTFDNGEVGITFWHYSQKYESNCNHLNFYEFFTDEELQQKFELERDLLKPNNLVTGRKGTT